MSYPKLRITRAYAHVEVREGRGAQRWQDMAEIFRGPATRGQEWKSGEGNKLSARHCMWPSDPASSLSLPYSVSGTEGLNVGQADVREFPAGVFSTKGIVSGGDEFASDALILHEDPRSGNCYKIRLTAALLGLPLAIRQYDIMRGETRTPDFLATVNANGRIPVLQIGEGDSARFLPESNAACWYLAEGSPLIPADRFDRADMLRWMFFEQYNHEPNIATLRFWLRFVGEGNLSDQQRAQIMPKRIAGADALRVMDEHLATRSWFVGGTLTLADIALYAYTHKAEEAGFGLGDYLAIVRWLKRVAAQPRFVTMD